MLITKVTTPMIAMYLSTLVMNSVSQGRDVPSTMAVNVAHSGVKIIRILIPHMAPHIFKFLFIPFPCLFRNL